MLYELDDLKKAYEFGKETISDYKDAEAEVPAYVFERQLEIADKIIRMLEG